MPKPNENQQQADKGQQETKVSADDLGLIDPALADEGRDHAEIWAEIEEAEGAAASGDDAKSPDDKKGDEGKETEGADDAAEVEQSSDAVANSSGNAQADDKPDAKAAGQQQKPQAIDLWADAKPEQRTAYEAAQAQLKKLEQATRSDRGRLSAMQRKIDELTRQPVAAKPAAKGTQGQQPDGEIFTSAEWKGLQEIYPEVADTMSKLFGGLQEKVTRQEKELSAIGIERRQSALAEQEKLLVDAHPDWTDVTSDQAFVNWLNGQPRHIREAAIRNANEIVDAEEAADVVGRYKAQRSEQQGGSPAQQTQSQNGNGTQTINRTLTNKRQLQLTSATAARSRGPGVTSGIPEDGDPETLWKQMDEMDRRQARA